MSGSRALPPRWLPQCSCVVIESSFDPGERLQAPGSLWLYYRTSEINCRIDFFGERGGGERVDYNIEHCHFLSYFFYQTFNLTLVKKYLKTAKIIDESLILAIVLHNYSTKPSYIFQLKT